MSIEHSGATSQAPGHDSHPSLLGPAEVNSLRQLHGLATPGKWSYRGGRIISIIADANSTGRQRDVVVIPLRDGIPRAQSQAEQKANGEYLVLLHDLLPAVLDSHDALAARVRELEAAAQRRAEHQQQREQKGGGR